VRGGATGFLLRSFQAKTGLAQSTVSLYMAMLERAGLVRSTRVGKWTHYRRDEEGIARLIDEIRIRVGPSLAERVGRS
jgi:ArsR family transcriptional regulator